MDRVFSADMEFDSVTSHAIDTRIVDDDCEGCSIARSHSRMHTDEVALATQRLHRMSVEV
jgi:hypothetical protein